MTTAAVLPADIRPEEFEAWAQALRHATGMALVVAPPHVEGAAVEANGERLATLSAIGAAPSRVAEAASLLSRLAQDQLARRDLVAQTARLWKEQNFLTSVATVLTVHATPEATAQRLLGPIIRLLGVRRASILLAREDGRLVVAAAEGISSSTPLGALIPVGGVADRVFKSGEPILVENLDRLPPEEDLDRLLHHEARTKSFLSVPILSNGVPVGVINVTDRIREKPFRAEDQKLVTAIAAQLGIAFANVRLLEEARRTEALKKELDLAARIQRSLLPRGPFRVPGFDVFGRCEPAAYVGGDSFEVSARPDGGLFAAIFDVSGHGMSAALLMASARAALRALIGADLAPAEAASALNNLICSDAGDTGMFLTAALVQVGGDGSVHATSMGHPPVLVRRADGGLEALFSGDTPAGILEDEPYSEVTTTLAPGESLLLYTDGLSEAEGDAGMMGDDGVATLFATAGEGGAETVTGRLFDAVYDLLQGRSVNDDITVLVARRLGRDVSVTR